MATSSAAALVAAALLTTAGCGHDDASSRGDVADDGNTDSTAALGQVPIPTAPAEEPVATANAQQPAVLEMGAPVLASLDDGTRAEVTMLGPVQSTTRPGAPSTAGTFTIAVRPVTGTTLVRAADFSSRNEDGKKVTLRPEGVDVTHAHAGRTARIRLTGHYSSGAAQVTWSHEGRPIAVWDFNIELD